MKRITDAQEGILKYLAKEKKFVSPTNIGLAFGCSYESASPWASPRCLGLVKKGLLVRSNRGKSELRENLHQKRQIRYTIRYKKTKKELPKKANALILFGRGGVIWTPDILLPKQKTYILTPCYP